METALFEEIYDHMIDNYKEVSSGKMMSSPALCFRKKVFAFFHQDKMTFKLGRDFIPEDMGINKWAPLSPFKNKAPMYDWFTISYENHTQWKNLCEMAMKKMSKS